MAAVQSQPADIVDYVAGGTVTAGAPVLSGTMLLVPIVSGGSGDHIPCHRTGMHFLPKVSAQAWTAGAALYWAVATSNVTSTVGANQRIGTAGLAAANPSASGWVILGQF